jgi:adenylate cyclase
MHRYEDGLAAGRRATELNPSFATGHHVFGIALLWAGRPAEAIEAITRAIRLSPNDIVLPFFFSGLAFVQYAARDYAKAAEAAARSVQMLPHNPIGQRLHAAALAQLGRLDEAQPALERALELSPGLNAETLRRSAPFRSDADYEHFAEGLRLAGWQG